MSSKYRHLAKRSSLQKGAVAIEFAALFTLLFTVFYAMLAYSIPILLTLTFNYLSAEAARAAIKVDPALAHEVYAEKISEQITQVIADSWLPTDWVDGNCPAPTSDLSWQALPASAGHPSYGHLGQEIITPTLTRYFLHVCLQRKYQPGGSGKEGAIIPFIQLPGIGNIPPLPTIDGEYILRGKSIDRL